MTSSDSVVEPAGAGKVPGPESVSYQKGGLPDVLPALPVSDPESCFELLAYIRREHRPRFSTVHAGYVAGCSCKGLKVPTYVEGLGLLSRDQTVDYYFDHIECLIGHHETVETMVGKMKVLKCSRCGTLQKHGTKRTNGSSDGEGLAGNVISGTEVVAPTVN